MTRTEPLTSLALGRSPYDDVVQGEGEGDPRAPVQMYDERGRPVNPEAKRLNRDLIRAHNEVMQAIGVAEPDDGAAERLEMQQRETRKMEADVIGHRLWNMGRIVEIGGVWGLNGLRNRILVYRQYSQIPFSGLYQFEKSRRSIASFCLSGVPSFVAETALRLLPLSHSSLSENNWVRFGVQYVRLHLQLFIFMQRIELVSPSTWLPGLGYFIPFSSSSPMPAPPPPRSLSPSGIIQWFGGVALSVVPMAAFWMYLRISTVVRMRIWSWVYKRLPTPTNYQDPFGSRQSQLSGDGARGSSSSSGSEQQPTTRHPSAISDRFQEDRPPVPTIRRQSTFSARGADDYGSDDERAGEGMSATLISFDVEATEATDTPPGQWSAELRPNTSHHDLAGGDGTGGGGGDGGGVGGEGRPSLPVYIDNMLTRLPATLATDILTIVSSNVLMAPFEAFALRTFARAFLRRHGAPQPGGAPLPLALLDMYDPAPWRGFSWTAVGNFLQLEAVHLLIQGELWSLMTLLSDHFRRDPEG